MRAAGAQSNLAPSAILTDCRENDQGCSTLSGFGLCIAMRGFRIELLPLGARITFFVFAHFDEAPRIWTFIAWPRPRRGEHLRSLKAPLGARALLHRCAPRLPKQRSAAIRWPQNGKAVLSSQEVVNRMRENESFPYYAPLRTKSASLFRQLVSNGGIKFTFPFVTVELKEDDLRRIHDIINEIDYRRVFYDSFDTEIPKDMVESVVNTKAAVHSARKGLWANDWAREMVQRLLHELGEFLTRTQSGVPRNHHDDAYPAFIEASVELRLRVWAIVAHLNVVFGPEVSPLHAPLEILQTVKEAYEIELARRSR